MTGGTQIQLAGGGDVTQRHATGRCVKIAATDGDVMGIQIDVVRFKFRQAINLNDTRNRSENIACGIQVESIRPHVAGQHQITAGIDIYLARSRSAEFRFRSVGNIQPGIAGIKGQLAAAGHTQVQRLCG